jgi:hypothetical protein
MPDLILGGKPVNPMPTKPTLLAAQNAQISYALDQWTGLLNASATWTDSRRATILSTHQTIAELAAERGLIASG